MADKRMLSKKITDHDNFISLSASAQALYMHLCMSADDDGFCNQVSLAMFKAHACTQDLEALISKKYIIQFDSGVVVIKHWRMQNTIRGDRKKDTAYQDELNCMIIKENGSYSLHSEKSEESELLPGETLRQRAYRISSLPYSFDYKIRNAFWGKTCPVCGAKMQTDRDEDGIESDNRIPTIQHNKPISKGGLHEIGNISVICKQCNISIRDNPTGSLNADEVAEMWQKITRQANDRQVTDKCQTDVGLDKISIDKYRLDKDRIGKEREGYRSSSYDEEIELYEAN